MLVILRVRFWELFKLFEFSTGSARQWAIW
jgi:hypothetical protein